MSLLKGNNILVFIAFLFGIVLPFANGLNNIVLVLFYASVIILALSKKLNFRKQNVKLLLYSTGLLILPVCWSFIVVEETSQVLIALERRISFLLSPLFFLFLSQKQIVQIKNYSFRGLVYGAVSSSLYLLIMVLNKYYAVRPIFTVDKDLFNYFHTSFYYTDTINIHPSYIGVYVLFALAILLFSNLFSSRLWKSSYITILTVSVLFLNSRLIQALYFILVFIYLWQILQSKFRNIGSVVIGFIVTTVVVGALFVSLFKNTYLYQRLTKELSWELSYEVGTKYNTKGSGDSRLARWDAALQLVKDRPMLGYGVSQESVVLKQQYLKMDMNTAAKEGYNAHNQFLGFAIEGGLIALALLCFYLFYNLLLSYRVKDIISLFFFLSVGIICLVENYLLRNAGITFVSFYATIFLYANFFKARLD